MRIFGIVAATGSLVAGLLGWIWLSGMGEAFRLPVSGASPAMLAYLLPATGVAVGAAACALAFLFRGKAEAPGPPAVAPGFERPAAPSGLSDAERAGQRRFDRAAIVIGIAFATTVALLITAVVDDQIKALPAAMVLICGTVTLVAACYALDGLARGQAIEVNSHWGGLGGSLGGWRLSPITTVLLLALVFLGATIVVGTDRRDSVENNMANQADGAGTIAERGRQSDNRSAGAPGGRLGAGTADAGANEAAANQATGQASANVAGGAR